ncbi:MAG: hypothetical protein Q7T26_05370 [Dehalococcoidia bacterium]|nr:hypothetical protein [Dehalococcoidia bacterium]
MSDYNKLESPDQWSWDAAQKSTPTKERRVIVSVAFGREDFERAAACAEKHNMPVSSFIRLAAMEKVEREGAFVPLNWSAGNEAHAYIIGMQQSVSDTPSNLIRREAMPAA